MEELTQEILSGPRGIQGLPPEVRGPPIPTAPNPRLQEASNLVRSGAVSIRGGAKAPQTPSAERPSLLSLLGRTPFERGISSAAMAAGVFFLLRPRIFFTEDGSVKRWSLLAPEEKDTTEIPIILGVFLAGLLGAYLV